MKDNRTIKQELCYVDFVKNLSSSIFVAKEFKCMKC